MKVIDITKQGLQRKWNLFYIKDFLIIEVKYQKLKHKYSFLKEEKN